MHCVATLIANPKTHGLRDSHIEAVRKALRERGAETERGEWLATGIACDVQFTKIMPHEAEAAIRGALKGLPFDVVAQATADRRKHLLIADMDSTMVTTETLDDLAAFVGLKDEIAAITTRAMNGELDFKDALRERIAMLKGLPEETLEQAWEEVELMPGAKQLVRTMRADGATCILVSGGFTFFTSRVRELCGFNADHSNVFDFEDGKLTGKVIEPILDKDSKLTQLLRYSSELEIPLDLSLAVGDGANDIPMLMAAGLGIAYHAKPVAAQTAKHRVDFGDLTALLYVQGYRDEEIVRSA